MNVVVADNLSKTYQAGAVAVPEPHYFTILPGHAD